MKSCGVTIHLQMIQAIEQYGSLVPFGFQSEISRILIFGTVKDSKAGTWSLFIGII